MYICLRGNINHCIVLICLSKCLNFNARMIFSVNLPWLRLTDGLVGADWVQNSIYLWCE